MFNKYSLTILVVAGLIFYLKLTEQYYLTCRKSIIDDQFFEKFYDFNSLDKYRQERYLVKIGKLKSLCKDFYVDFSSNYIMNNTIGYMASFIYGDQIQPDQESVRSFVESTNPENFKLSLYSIKFVQILIYIIILYFCIVSVPNIAVQVLLTVVNKVLVLVFIIFALGAVSKFYLGVDFDITNKIAIEKNSWFEYLDLFPLNYLMRLLNFLFKLF
jgi:hypothetical protein